MFSLYEIGKALTLTAQFQKERSTYQRDFEFVRKSWLDDGVDRMVGAEEEWAIEYVRALEER